VNEKRVSDEQLAIRTGDAVLHKPTGETWLVAYCEGGYVCCCGWPATLAKVSDCELVRKGTDEEWAGLLMSLAVMQPEPGGSPDCRMLYAKRAIRAALADREPQEAAAVLRAHHGIRE
jgi:hypothetical protein